MLVTRPLNLALAGYFSSTPSHGSASSCFMPREMRWVSGLKRMTWTLTLWPIFSASEGWLLQDALAQHQPEIAPSAAPGGVGRLVDDVAQIVEPAGIRRLAGGDPALARLAALPG